MNTQQSKALLLADEIQLWNNPCARAANELRRLHSVNAELLEALKEVVSLEDSILRDIWGSEFVEKACAAIAKAQE
jgi:hypothetical protein